jgi:hypothetical protein
MLKDKKDGINAKENIVFLSNRHDEEFIEENAITELNQVAILSSSKLSLRKNHDDLCKDALIEDRQKSKLELFIDRIPLKGYILVLLSTFFTASMTILLKLATTLSGSDAGSMIDDIFQFL